MGGGGSMTADLLARARGGDGDASGSPMCDVTLLLRRSRWRPGGLGGRHARRSPPRAEGAAVAGLP